MSKQFIVLDNNGNPIMQEGDQVNPYLFYSLVDAVEFAKKESKNADVSIAEVIILDRIPQII